MSILALTIKKKPLPLPPLDPSCFLRRVRDCVTHADERRGREEYERERDERCSSPLAALAT